MSWLSSTKLVDRIPRWREMSSSSWALWLLSVMQNLRVLAKAVKVGIMFQSFSKACSSVTSFHLVVLIAKPAMASDSSLAMDHNRTCEIYYMYAQAVP